MKRLLLIVVSFLAIAFNGYSQCTPNAATGTPGVTPAPDAIPCVERGVFYDFTMQIENFTQFNFTVSGFAVTANVNWTRIDSIENLPCGITWQADKLQMNGGETACVRVSGTSTEAVGQYPLKIYISMNATVVQLSQTITFTGELDSLVQELEQYTGPLGHDFKYVSRVIDPGNICPSRDTTSTLITSGDVCQSANLSVSVVTNPAAICAGQSSTLTANVTNATGTPTFQWSGSAGTTASVSVSPTTPTTYTVTVTDGSQSVTGSVFVNVTPLPNASFTATVSEDTVSVTNTTITGGVTTYTWHFGESSNPLDTVLSANPAPYVYGSDDTFTITLIAANLCGSDTATQNVVIDLGVFAPSIEQNLSFNIAPNPANEKISVSFSSEISEDMDLQIFDLTGKMVYSEKITGTWGNFKKVLDVSGFSKGIYNIQLKSASSFGLKRLVLQ